MHDCKIHIKSSINQFKSCLAVNASKAFQFFPHFSNGQLYESLTKVMFINKDKRLTVFKKGIKKEGERVSERGGERERVKSKSQLLII